MWLRFNWSVGRTPIEPALARIEQTLDRIMRYQEELGMDLTKLQAAVAAETQVDQSAVVLIQQIADALKAANASGDQAAVDALAAQLSASAATLGSAVAANTTSAAPPTV